MTAPKPEQGGEEKYRKLWERLKAEQLSALGHWRVLLSQYRERGQAKEAMIASREIDTYQTMLNCMQRLEAESGGKDQPKEPNE